MINHGFMVQSGHAGLTELYVRLPIAHGRFQGYVPVLIAQASQHGFAASAYFQLAERRMTGYQIRKLDCLPVGRLIQLQPHCNVIETGRTLPQCMRMTYGDITLESPVSYW